MLPQIEPRNPIHISLLFETLSFPLLRHGNTWKLVLLAGLEE